MTHFNLGSMPKIFSIIPVLFLFSLPLISCGGLCESDKDCPGAKICSGYESLFWDGRVCVFSDKDLVLASSVNTGCGDVTQDSEGFETDNEVAPICSDMDQDGFKGTGDCDPDDSDFDCNDRRDDIYPGALERCDSFDNDCNGFIDTLDPDMVPRLCAKQAGVCEGTTSPCVDGKFQHCSDNEYRNNSELYTPLEKDNELLCDNLDNDCDGQTDEDLEKNCYSGPERTANVGACREGTQLCAGGDWGLCEDEVWPGEETCLNLNVDNDCNGEMDDVEGLGEVCETEGFGICQFGTKECIDGELGCSADNAPGEETCENPGSDDNCNGVDDDVEGLGEECDTGGLGICAPGVWVCTNSDKVCLANETPGIEECDGVDSDCDGVVDEIDEDACGQGEVCLESGLCQCGDYGGHCTNSEICSEGRCCSDGRCTSPMVIIPEGAFMMGCNESVDSNCDHDDGEEPYHEVNVPEFRIDVTEVTVGQYRACVEDNDNCSEPSVGEDYCNWTRLDREDHPVNCVAWYQAIEYCTWSNKRLCSESEWEKAARGTDGRIYPWGNQPVTCDRAVMCEDRCWSNHNYDGYGCGTGHTWPVASKSAGIYGLYDMSGNIWEWVEDDRHWTYEGAPDDGSAWVDVPRSQDARVMRGGSFRRTFINLRSSSRWYARPNDQPFYLGVRCCRNGL